jgi:endoglycosylceramidase
MVWLSVAAAVGAAVAAAVAAGMLGPAAPGGSRGPVPSLASPLRPAPDLLGRPAVSGALAAPGGPFLYDSHGRVVFLHGVDVVYKHPPYEVYPDPGKPWNFGPADASLMARLGFDVVRLGIMWAGLEPGTAPANDPAICRPGPPGDPHQFDAAVLHRYLVHVRQTVDLLGRYHIYTLLDMHQDVYNQMFDGEGEPDWAVCTDGVRSVDPPGRWSRSYATRAAGIAFDHFWDNDVVGNLQGQYDLVWGAVARFFRNDPWVVGYDPFNEPFSASLVRHGDEHFDGQLECFYTGTAHVGSASHHAPAIHCPPQDPHVGVIPTILANDPHHLVFDEPDNYASRGLPTFIGPMDFPRLVYNVHVYCGARNPRTGNPTDVPACSAQELRSLARRSEDRLEMRSPAQRAGPAWFVSEYGATSDAALVSAVAAAADAHMVGWCFWAWKYYADPTGSAAEGLVMADGRLRSVAYALSRVYPEAVSGTPRAISFDPATGGFSLRYTARRAGGAPTVVFVPTTVDYPRGYCARASGAVIGSRPGSELLVVRDRRGARVVTVTVSDGRCPAASARPPGSSAPDAVGAVRSGTGPS